MSIKQKIKKYTLIILLLLTGVNVTLFGCCGWQGERKRKPAIQTGIIKYGPREYKNTCLIAYQWDKNGTTWVLLGKEKRGKKGQRQFVWFDFCGKKSTKDKNSWQTAKREGLEETAGSLKFKKGITFTYRGKKNKDTIHYIVPVRYTKTRIIEKNRKRLKDAGKGKNIEKVKWRWVKLENLIDGRTNLNLYWLFEKKLKNPIMLAIFRTLIKKGRSLAQ